VDLMTREPVPVDLVRDAGHAELARRAVQNVSEGG
jgi:hypothetical protein